MQNKIIVPPFTLTNGSSQIKVLVPSDFYNRFPVEYQKFAILIGLYGIVQFGAIDNDKFDNYCRWRINLENLAEYLDKKSVIEIIGLLPAFGEFKNVFKSDKERDLTIDFYTGLKEWLHHWEDNLDTSDIQFSYYAAYEGFAIEAKRRYELISALFSRKQIDETLFINPNLAWLLAQTSIFWGQMDNKCGSREELYQNVREYLDQLEYFGEDPPNYEVTNEDVQLNHADIYFDTLARNLAVDDSDFDKYYFKPYMMAKRQWNSYGRKKLEMFHVGETPAKKRPGRKLGYKKKSEM